MKVLMTAFSGPVSAIILVAVAVLLFTIILQSLRECSFFGGTTAVIVAVCVTILCIIGLHEFFIIPVGSPGYRPASPNMDIGRSAGSGGKLLLLPYASLSVAILLLLLLLLARRIVQCGKERRSDRKSERSVIQEADRRHKDRSRT